MRIAFDCDGVLTKLVEFQEKNGKQFFERKNKKVEIDDTKLSFNEMFNCTDKEESEFWIKYIWKYCLEERARENASNVINRFKSEGNEIYIITARAHTTEKNAMGMLFRKMLEYWLKREKIPYDKIFYCNEETSASEKLNICIDEKIDIIYEDQKKNIDSLKNVTNVVYFREKHNSDVSGDNVIEAIDFNDSYMKVANVNKQEKNMGVKQYGKR